ncbi:MAG: bifunctional diaminohydroxyphosphoribosylaminopyrimidine deaminase/5-amino-6-(5-phosphoribosylamino)uracil reductase RibD [Candidatus Eisenbacteria bacterium]|nr:bifunctional diaminohydroxyphosphoribosylaminopyrimidine deaminase/5-amino-6-(5-phosphoribosylamino)uracil reductase RibD [Candidatus Eisenbacteria bacterium]
MPVAPRSPRLDINAAMDRALSLARRGLARARPNPMVGSVVLRDGRVVGRGWHACFGGPHAEVVALEDAGRAARGSTLVVTLEPCAHHGKTPPCTEAILRAGVKRVVAATLDPNPAVAGRGLDFLRRRRVVVEVGAGADGALRLNEGYFSSHVRGRPFVTLKVASTLDGRLGAADGTSRYISGPHTLRYAHRLRTEVHAILVGRATVEADDPQLTTRLVRGPSPVRVVLDTRGVLRPAARVFAAGEARTLWVTGPRVPVSRLRPVLARGVEHVEVRRARDGGLDLRRVLRELARRQLQSVLVEGGSRVATAFVAAGLVDRVMVAVAPRLLGAGNVGWLGDLGIRTMRDLRHLMFPEVRVMGTDALFSGYLTDPSDLLEGWVP